MVYSMQIQGREAVPCHNNYVIKGDTEMKKEGCLAYSLMKEHDSDLYGYAPAYEGAGTEELVYSLDDYKSYYVYEHGAGEKDYHGYCDKLEREGFELYSSNGANGNLFATYTDGDNIVNVAFVSYRDVDKYVVRERSYVVISVDSVRNSTLPFKAEPYEKICDVQLINLSCVLTAVVRLEDGRFLVIDSCVGSAADTIYEALCRLNVRGGKPTVAAWMFSHAHGDHVGGFIGILDKYADKIEVERVIHNFPGEQIYGENRNYMEGVPNREGEWMTKRSREIHRLMKEKMPNGRYTIAHAGQIFEYPGVKLEVLMTTENLYQKQMFDSNMSSVVYSLTMPHGRVLALGDAVDGESKMLRKIYGRSLKSDLVFLAHHGFNGGDEEMYHDIGATVSVWPCSWASAAENAGSYVNHFDCNSVKYNLCVPDGEVEITLYDGVPESELKRFDYPHNVPKTDDVVCYESRKNPKHYLTEAQLAEGYGDAPRYYGKGEETETFVLDPESKTYEITISGVTRYEYDYYWNTFKRDGYIRMEESCDGDNRYVTFADPLNEVHLSYVDGVITAKVGPAGKNVFDCFTMMAKGGKRVIPE